jgi:hypothetical protein
MTLHYPVPVPSLLKRWKRLEPSMGVSAKTFDALNTCFGDKTKQWLKAEKYAQLNRHEDSALRDIYDTTTAKGMVLTVFDPLCSNIYIQLPLVQKSSRI